MTHNLIDLRAGNALAGLSAHDIEDVAARFSREGGLTEGPRLDDSIEYDQWTVSGEFNRERPLSRFMLGDPAATQLYVSSVSGQAVQVTTAHERFWNWLGAIPHWLYFAGLRRNVAVWRQVVIWTSLIGCFLTLTGLYIGVRQFLRRPRERWSPYRGMTLWHHVPGLIFGLFALSWVASGLVSMNPWGFLDSGGHRLAMRVLRGEPTTGAQVKAALHSLPALARLPGIVSVESVPLWGKLYLVATTRQLARWRFDATGASARIESTDWTKVVHALNGQDRSGPDLLTQGDSYYFERRGSEAPLPVYRIVVDDPQQTRYYLDPLTARLVAGFDTNARSYRWLHQGLHTLDFTPALRTRPAWYLLMLSLLAGVTMVCVTGTYLAARRIFRPVRRRESGRTP